MVLIFSRTGGKIHDQPLQTLSKILPCIIINFIYSDMSL